MVRDPGGPPLRPGDAAGVRGLAAEAGRPDRGDVRWWWPSQGDGHQGSLRPFGDGYWGSLRPFDDATGGTSARTVILWPDTFTNHLSPEVGRAAVRVLEAAGLRPLLPPTAPLRQPGGALTQSVLPRLHRPPLCCGLTYVSTGQLDRARRVMRRTVEVLSPLLQDGHPLVVLEPSCAAALRTDLPELLVDDPAQPNWPAP